MAMLVIAFTLSYVIGSIPFGLLLGLLAGEDIRQKGSRNIGATNTFRVCGPIWGVSALLLDAFKGVVPVIFISRLIDNNVMPILMSMIICGVLAILGHNFPVWLKFKGGKGVATSAGVVAALMFKPFLVALVVFILTVTISKYISLGSMVAAVALLISTIILIPHPWQENFSLTILACFLAITIIVKHHSNIKRLLKGTENKFQIKSKQGKKCSV